MKRNLSTRNSKWFRAGRTVFGREDARNIMRFGAARDTVVVTRKQLEQTARHWNTSAFGLASMLGKGYASNLLKNGRIEVSKDTLRRFYDNNTGRIEYILNSTELV